MNFATHKQETTPLKFLKEADYNHRDITPAAMESLKTGLRTFGLVQPIVARKEDGLVIGGHQRLAAMRELLKEQGLPPAEVAAFGVPVVLLSGLSDKQAKALNLALNKISGEWDFEKLATVVADISAPELIQLSGFSTGEIEDILGLLGGAQPLLPSSKDLDEQISEGLATQARRFVFAVATDEEAAECTETLRAFGMTGPGDSAKAFIAALKAALVFFQAAEKKEAQDAHHNKKA